MFQYQNNVEGGDRGHIAVNVPSPVVPYVPNQSIQHTNMLSDGSIWQKFQQTSGLRRSPQRPENEVSNAQNSLPSLTSTYDLSHSKVDQSNQFTASRNSLQPTSQHSNVQNRNVLSNNLVSDVTSAADFSSFKDTNHPPALKVQGNDNSDDEGFHETDRIDVPSLIDPNALIYSSNSAPYGEQYPSYIPDSMATVVGTTLNTDKQLSSKNNIVYGRGKVLNKKKDSSKAKASNIDTPSKLSSLKNVFMSQNSYENEMNEDEYYDEDYDDYDDMMYSDDFEHSGDDYDDELYEDDEYLKSLNKKLKLVDQILKESSTQSALENFSDKGKQNNRLPELVDLWKKSMNS